MSDGDPIEESDVAVQLPLVGYLTYREIHAVVDGFYAGYRDLDARDHDYDKEQHYWRFGWISGREYRRLTQED